MTVPLTRRALMAAGGGVAVAFSLGGVAAAQAKPMLDAWIRIDPAGAVTLATGKVELGQGVLTALAQICADELDVALERLSVISGDTALTPDDGITAGSLSMPVAGTALRLAAAEARHILLQRAAQRLKAPIETLAVQDGVVRAPDGRTAGYGDLAAAGALAREATGAVPPKPADRRRYVGRPVSRRDLPAKILGRPAFLQDARPEGMVHARVLRPPTQGSVLDTVDEALVARLPGVLRIVRDGSFLGVIAAREDQALAAVEALEKAANWRDRPAAAIDQDGVYDWLKAQPAEVATIKPVGSPPPAARRFSAVYRRPCQMHGSIGPSAAIGFFDGDGYLIQTHSQSVFDTARAIAQMLGVAPEKVRLQHLEGSGCYGHNGADDVAADAALLARAMPGVPVRIQWRRRDEHAWEPYGSAMQMEIRAGLSADGTILSWACDLWSNPHSTRPGGQAGNLAPARALAKPFPQPAPFMIPGPSYGPDRNAIPAYEIPAQTVTTHLVKAMPVRTSSLRSLGAYANVFAIESFMDELARAAGADPLAFRLRHLKDPRAKEVIQKAAGAFGWASFAKASGRGRGLAYARYKNLAAYCAICIEAEVDRASGVIRVVRAVAACDAGEAVNPDGIANQIEGGLIQALSWSLKEEVRFQAGRILSDSWAEYPILKFSEVPPVEVVLLDRPGQPFLGAGEASQGPTPAALANAVFDASGLRLRTLPFTPARVKAARGERSGRQRV